MTKQITGKQHSLGAVGFLIGLACVMAGAFLLKYVFPDFILIPLLPAAFLIGYIFATRRILEALVLSSVMCYILADGVNFFREFGLGLTEVMMDEDTGWLMIVCGLMGSIVVLIEKAGGLYAFGTFFSKRCKSKRGTLVATWVLGTLIFLDDYLNSLTVGSCMAPLTDKHKVSREKLAYIVDSTAAPDCVLFPISTWAVFASRILAENGLYVEGGSQIAYFLKTIPFNFYAWFAFFIVFAVCMGWIPDLGPMKKAQQRVMNGGPLAPPNSEKMDIHNNTEFSIPENPKMINFLLPLAVLIVSTIVTGTDLQAGVLITLAFMFFFYIGQGLMTPDEFTDYCIEGLKNMLLPILLMILAFLFSGAADRIQFTQTIIEWLVPIMTPELMAIEIFIVLAITEFITGTNWGLYIIALPIVIPLSQAIGGNTVLAVSSVLSAGVFGSHICFYSDATILSSSASGCNNFDHAITQLPYGLLAGSLAGICFLATGFIMH